MDAFLTIGSAVGMGLVALVWWFGHRESRAWRRAGDALGLIAGETAQALDGQVDDCRVIVRGGLDGGSAEVVVRPDRAPPAGLGFGPEGLVQSVLNSVTGADVLTGDRAFDDAVMMIGDPPTVLAVLDPATRRLVRRLVAEGAVLDGGELRLRGRLDGRRLAETVRALIRAARALAITPAEVPRRLLDRVRRDPLPGVRRAALDLLLARSPDAPETTEALRVMLGDRDPALRLTAARHLEGERDPAAESAEALRALARDPAVDRRTREETLDLFIERFGARRASPLLVELLADDAVGGDAAVRLARTLRVEALPALCARVGVGAIEVRGECAAAIGRLGDPRDGVSEAALLPLLDEAPLRAAAAVGLGRVGTLRSLEALLPLTEGLFTASDVKAAAQQAVQRIRARRGAAEGIGGLSVADPGEAGGLALAESRAGALALDAGAEGIEGE